MASNEPQRNVLLTAARKLFFECGYNNTTMRNIAAQAGVSTAMPNYYFISKTALGVEVYCDTRKEINALAEQLFPLDHELLSRILAAITANTQMTITEPRYRELYLAVSSSQQFYEMLSKSTANIYALAGNPDEGEVFHAVAVAGIHSALLHYLDSNPDTPVRELVKYYVRQFVRPLDLSRQYFDSMFDSIYEIVVSMEMKMGEGFEIIRADRP